MNETLNALKQATVERYTKSSAGLLSQYSLASAQGGITPDAATKLQLASEATQRALKATELFDRFTLDLEEAGIAVPNFDEVRPYLTSLRMGAIASRPLEGNGLPARSPNGAPTAELPSRISNQQYHLMRRGCELMAGQPYLLFPTSRDLRHAAYRNYSDYLTSGGHPDIDAQVNAAMDRDLSELSAHIRVAKGGVGAAGSNTNVLDSIRRDDTARGMRDLEADLLIGILHRDPAAVATLTQVLLSNGKAVEFGQASIPPEKGVVLINEGNQDKVIAASEASLELYEIYAFGVIIKHAIDGAESERLKIPSITNNPEAMKRFGDLLKQSASAIDMIYKNPHILDDLYPKLRALKDHAAEAALSQRHKEGQVVMDILEAIPVGVLKKLLSIPFTVTQYNKLFPHRRP